MSGVPAEHQQFRLDLTVSGDTAYVSLPSLVVWLEQYAQLIERRSRIPPVAAQIVRNIGSELLLHDLQAKRL